MKIFLNYLLFTVTLLFGFNNVLHSTTLIPADNPYIQYYGRWDMSGSLNPTHSWPGIFICAKFSGTSIGIRMQDSVNYYDVYIDGKFHSVFHSAEAGEEEYILADSLRDTIHTFRFSQRNISFGVYTFSGLLLDDGAKLYPLPPKPERKIEFIGDSYTAAEGNEAKQLEMEWKAKFPVTDIDKGFASIIARHFHAQYHITARSGIGMVCNWQGNFDISMPHYFDRTLMERKEPKWNFHKWVPNLVVICLGLNDFSGLKNKVGVVSEKNSEIFRKGYHNFLKTLRKVYPGVPILVVAAQDEWIQKNEKQIVAKEKAEGHNDIYYSQFGSFPGGYVANGHPNVATHKKIADTIIKAIDKYNFFPEEK